ncbi:MAG: hypothetical protein MK077_07380 [Phycisphaerales bacterium]|nr:hypothetical protein [Phycisphaerales bacterium]
MPILTTASLILGLHAIEAPSPVPTIHNQAPVVLAAGDALGMAMHRRHGDTPLRLSNGAASLQVAVSPQWTKPTTNAAITTPWWFAMMHTSNTLAVATPH